jgi:Zn finger protein HypA/HybF involved in hydrogenase expression
MSFWNGLAAGIGRAIAEALPESLKERIRGSYAAKHGRCRRCKRPLAGASPSQICETCHADELLAHAGGGSGGDA